VKMCRLRVVGMDSLPFKLPLFSCVGLLVGGEDGWNAISKDFLFLSM
jgi:hypothetical protein